MKNINQLIIIALSLFTSLSYSQFDNELVKRNWKVGKEKTIYGTPVTRLEGNNGPYQVTNIGLKTLDLIISETEKSARSEMWVDGKKEKLIAGYKEVAKGGVLFLYLGRITLETAQLDNFTVIVMDSDDKTELTRKELSGSSPSVPSDSMLKLWTNSTFVPIPVERSGIIYVYVIDRTGGPENRYKFKI